MVPRLGFDLKGDSATRDRDQRSGAGVVVTQMRIRGGEDRVRENREVSADCGHGAFGKSTDAEIVGASRVHDHAGR